MSQQITIPKNYTYMLRSIERQLREFSELMQETQQFGPTLGGEILADNLNWLGCHLDTVERTVKEEVK